MHGWSSIVRFTGLERVMGRSEFWIDWVIDRVISSSLGLSLRRLGGDLRLRLCWLV